MSIDIQSLQYNTEDTKELYSNIISSFNHLFSNLLKEPGGIGESSYKSLISLGNMISPEDTLSMQKFVREVDGRFLFVKSF